MFHLFNNKAKVITPHQAKDMMNQDHVVVVDVREDYEYNQGHIKNARLIPLNTIGQNNEVMPDLHDTVLVYCRSGKRSQKGATKFKQLGYENVYDFGGILDWPYEIVK